MRPEVLITQPQAKSCVDRLTEEFSVHHLHNAAHPEALLAEVGPRILAIAGGKVSASLMARLPNLEIIAMSGVGVDSIDVPTARTRGIRITNTPEVLNDAVAELSIGLMIALSRQLPRADRYVREGKWEEKPYPLTSELKGKVLGILGLGRIGKEIATLASALKMEVVYHGRHRQDDQPYGYYGNLVDMARDADWLLAIAPAGEATRGIVSREVMEALGPDGRLVNVARGSLVDQPAMLELLQSGALGGAALDVFEGEPKVPQALRALPNVVLSPHQGSRTEETRDAVGALVVRNLHAHFAGEPLLTPVV